MKRRSLAAILMVHTIACFFVCCYTLIYPLILLWVKLTANGPKETRYREDVKDLWIVVTQP